MSALDQALIKAYAKDRPAAAGTATAEVKPRPVVSPLRSASASPASAQAVDRIYYEGGLYRAETPAAAYETRGVPAPHLAMLPPTSPRRNVRRSMLRALATRGAVQSSDAAAEMPQRVARKVIIRHILHNTPPPLGLMRLGRGTSEEFDAELPPEALPTEPTPPVPENPSPVSPLIVPLNIAVDEIGAIEVRGDWEHEAAFAPMVLVAEVNDSDAPSMVVNVQLEALERADEAASMPFAAKSLDEQEEPRIYARADGPHAYGRHRPHGRFAKPVVEELSSAEDDSASQAEADRVGDLTFAEASIEALASDLIPSVGESAAADALERAEAVSEASRPAIPQWEVDRFHWPRTCEKLFADEHGYLARAGDKLHAAMQDGLKVLAVTGSRRGEGRSTLALCLARAAAQVGIQAAVMDADFSRPQLASKVGVEVTHGWQDAALGRVPLSEAAVRSVADKITLLPLESSAATRALSLADPRVTATIRAAAATFELLILDLGPQGTTAIEFPAGEICPLDAAIVVRDLRFATVAESETIGHALHDAGVEAVGIAENFVIEDEIPATSV